MAYIHSVTTGLPPFTYSTMHIAEIASAWLNDSPHERALFERLCQTTKIEQRHFALPLPELLKLNGAAGRAEIFNEVGGALLHRIIVDGLRDAGLSPEEVSTLITTSCSVPVIPSLDTHIIDTLGLRPTITRVPVFQYGCAGGAIGLALAERLTDWSEVTVLASVELCSLVHQSGDHRAGNLVGSAIFSDGAACVILSRHPSLLKVGRCRSFTIPNTCHLMGYDIHDDGTHLRLDKEVPQALLNAAPRAVSDFLRSLDLTTQDVSWWLFHPGGVKILSSLEAAFDLSRDQTRWSWESLRDFGNMSSASILFVLEAFMREKPFAPGDNVLMLGVGPGLTLQINLLECC